MERGDRRLQLVRPAPAPAQRRLQDRQALGDLVALPAAPVLLLERDQRAAGVDPGRAAGVMQQHQGEQALGLRLVGQQLHQQPAEADRLAAEIGAHQAVAFGAGIAFVEHQVDDAEHRLQPLGQELARRHLVRNPGVEDLALGAHQPLRRGRLRLEKGARDLPRRQAAERSQRQRHLRRLGDRRVAAGEHQAQAIVLDARRVVPVDASAFRLGRRHVGRLVGVERTGGAPAQQVDGTAPGHGREPGGRRRRQALRRPDLERLGEGVLHRVLGELEVADPPDQAREQARTLGAADAVDDRRQHGARAIDSVPAALHIISAAR